MYVEWIKFYGVYGDAEFRAEKDGIAILDIVSYSPAPDCGRTELQIYCTDGTRKIRSLDGANYDYKEKAA